MEILVLSPRPPPPPYPLNVDNLLFFVNEPLLKDKQIISWKVAYILKLHNMSHWRWVYSNTKYFLSSVFFLNLMTYTREAVRPWQIPCLLHFSWFKFGVHKDLPASHTSSRVWSLFISFVCFTPVQLWGKSKEFRMFSCECRIIPSHRRPYS